MALFGKVFCECFGESFASQVALSSCKAGQDIDDEGPDIAFKVPVKYSLDGLQK